MATYVIGDVQGCYEALLRLLDRCSFGETDEIWFTGDLVNRGPRSADVLRFAKGLDDRCRAVLGNHDLHLLGCAAGVARVREGDTIQDVLDAPDREELLGWLRDRPFVIDSDPWLVVHAGVLPAWDRTTLLARARHAEVLLRSSEGMRLLREYSRRAEPDLAAHRDEHPLEEAVATARILANLRCCDSGGRPRLDYAGPPEEAPGGLTPWYASEGRAPLGRTVICGHWAAQGVRRTHDMVALDSGCVWGGRLSAFRIDDDALVAVSCGAPD